VCIRAINSQWNGLVVRSVVSWCSQIVGTCMSGCLQVTNVKACATDKVTGMKEYGMNTLSAVSDLGSKQVSRAMEVPVLRQSVSQLDVMLDVADHYVDSLLPDTGNNLHSQLVTGTSFRCCYKLVSIRHW